MHTDMSSSVLEDDFVEKSRILWWTVYVLERQMSSLMGIPMGIVEDCISARLPALPGQLRRSESLQIQVKLSQALSQIDKSERLYHFSVEVYSNSGALAVYGVEGTIDSRYLKATQAALKSIAGVADQLNDSFSLHTKDVFCGMSRLSAHLHMFQHQVGGQVPCCVPD